MRTGAEYRNALHDGRKVWVLGEGPVKDVTVHAATQAVVDDYAAWYDRHFDPEWQDIVLTPPDERGDRSPWGYVVPKNAAYLTRMGRCFSRTTFLSAGNLTHTPAYGQLIALGVLCAAQEAKVSPKQIGDAAAYRELIAGTGRFLTFSAGAATIGYRMREDPADRTALKIVRETDAGLVLSGKIGMHTSPAYAEDVYVGAFSGVDIDG
jgi:aromatic ring hydroxylase